MRSQSRQRATAVAALSIFTGLALQVVPSYAQVFTAEQAAKGRDAYAAQCAMCHGADLLGPDAPALIGTEVMQNFDTAGGLYGYIAVAMPPQAPGRLGEETYVNILAYILEANGAQAGDEELTADIDHLGSIELAAITSAVESAATGPATEAATPQTDVPQAYTWGMKLPSVNDSAEEEEEEASVPQAYTWGQELPRVGDDQ